MKKKDKIKIGSAYHIYCKLPDMKQYRPLGNGKLEINLIYACIFSVFSQGDKEKLQKEIDYIRKKNNCLCQLREVKNYLIKS